MHHDDEGSDVTDSQASLEARLQRLEDIQEISALFMSYRRTLDEREFGTYAELFAPDGEWTGNLGSFTGPAAIKQMLEDSVGTAFAIEPGDDFHLVANPDIHVDGDRATASSTWVFVTRDGDDARRSPCSGTTPTCSRARPAAGGSCAARRSVTSPRSTSASNSDERSERFRARGVEMSMSQGIGVMAGRTCRARRRSSSSRARGAMPPTARRST